MAVEDFEWQERYGDQTYKSTSLASIRITFFAIHFAQLVVLPSLAVRLATLHASVTVLAFSLAACCIGELASGNFFSYWYDRRPAREVVVGSLLLNAVAMIGYSLSPNGICILISRFLVGCAAGVQGPLLTLVGSMTNKMNRSEVLASMRVMYLLAFVLGAGLSSTATFVHMDAPGLPLDKMDHRLPLYVHNVKNEGVVAVVGNTSAKNGSSSTRNETLGDELWDFLGLAAGSKLAMGEESIPQSGGRGSGAGQGKGWMGTRRRVLEFGTWEWVRRGKREEGSAGEKGGEGRAELLDEGEEERGADEGAEVVEGDGGTAGEESGEREDREGAGTGDEGEVEKEVSNSTAEEEGSGRREPSPGSVETDYEIGRSIGDENYYIPGYFTALVGHGLEAPGYMSAVVSVLASVAVWVALKEAPRKYLRQRITPASLSRRSLGYFSPLAACVGLELLAQMVRVSIETVVAPLARLWGGLTCDAIAVYMMGIAVCGVVGLAVLDPLKRRYPLRSIMVAAVLLVVVGTVICIPWFNRSHLWLSAVGCGLNVAAMACLSAMANQIMATAVVSIYSEDGALMWLELFWAVTSIPARIPGALCLVFLVDLDQTGLYSYLVLLGCALATLAVLLLYMRMLVSPGLEEEAQVLPGADLSALSREDLGASSAQYGQVHYGPLSRD